MKGLEGRLLPSRGPLDLYEFRGKTGDGSSIHAHAAVLGRWMYMRGFTEPPPGSADFFEYRFKTLARRGPSADSMTTAWSMPRTLLPCGMSTALADDIRNDLTIGAGLSDWRQQFGEATPDLTVMDTMLSSALSSFVTVASVPEPTGLCLVDFRCPFDYRTAATDSDNRNIVIRRISDPRDHCREEHFATAFGKLGCKTSQSSSGNEFCNLPVVAIDC